MSSASGRRSSTGGKSTRSCLRNATRQKWGLVTRQPTALKQKTQTALLGSMLGRHTARLVSVATLVLMVAAGLAQPASATVPGLNGRIVFGSGGLSTMKPDGTGLVPLTLSEATMCSRVVA